MALNLNLYPQSGYVYYTLTGAKLVASSWGELASKLQEYKKLQGQNISYDDALRLIEEQVCQRDPTLCHSRRPIYPDNLHKAIPGAHGSYVTRALAWLRKKAMEASQKVLALVTKDHAEQRAATCFKCPLMSFYVNTCSTCSANLAALRKTVLTDRVEPFKNLGFCKLVGEDLGVAVWLDEEQITGLRAPNHCWRCK